MTKSRLASVSFCPLLIVESMARVSQHVLFLHDLLIKHVKRLRPINCFDCKTGVFSDYSFHCLQKKATTIYVFAKKSTRLWGIFSNYKGKLIVPRVHTAALIES